MCGIFGGVTYSEHDASKKLAFAREVLMHRGPDSHGEILRKLEDKTVFGSHFRLAIQDPNKRSDQPMTCAAGCHTILYNGEIYNFKSLAEGLYSSDGTSLLKTGSDTEVLLELWCSLGYKCLHLLEGMFAFAIFDWTEMTITLARDRYGVKPLFFESRHNGLDFSSEIRALDAYYLGDFDKAEILDFLVIDRYMRFPRTFFSGAESVLPGEIVKIEIESSKNGLLGIDRKKWTKPLSVDKTLTEKDFEETKKLVRKKFLKSVEMHLISDTPLAFALSGGIDSAAIVCAARLINPKMEIHTFSYIHSDPSLSEERYVDLVNEQVGGTQHKVYLEESVGVQDFESFLRCQGGPVNNTHFFAQYLVFKAASKAGFKVVLEGQGADEIIGGYDGYPSAKFYSMVGDKGLWAAAHRILSIEKLSTSKLSALTMSYLARSRGSSSLVSKSMRSAFSVAQGTRIQDAFGFFLNKSPKLPKLTSMPQLDNLNDLNQELWLSAHQDLLPRLLHHGDHNAMAHGVENRVPFLGNEFSEFMLSLPHQFLVSDNFTTKYIFKEAMRGIVPDEILDRPAKMGFPAEIEEILNKLGRPSRVRFRPGSMRRQLLEAWLSVVYQARDKRILSATSKG